MVDRPDSRVTSFRITVNRAHRERVNLQLMQLMDQGVFESFTEVAENGTLESFVIYLTRPMKFGEIIAHVSEFLPRDSELGVN